MSSSIRRRMILGTAALGFAAASFGCDSPVAPSTRAGPPAQLEFHMGGYGAVAHLWRVQGDTLLLLRMPWDEFAPDSTRVVPTLQEWDRFWQKADLAGVHRWRSSYSDPTIMDGVGWSLRLRSGGLRVHSQGSNAFPDNFGRERSGDLTPAFRLFMDALEELTARNS